MTDRMEELIDAARAYHRAGVRKFGEQLKAEGRRKMYSRLKDEDPKLVKRILYYWRTDLDDDLDDGDE
jgi:hypothetical protein